MCTGSHQLMQVVAESYKCLQKRHYMEIDLTQVFRPPAVPALVGIRIGRSLFFPEISVEI